MSNIDISTAFIVVRPDTRQFASQLQSQVNAAVAAVKVPPLTAAINTAGGTVGASTAAASTAAVTNLKRVERASEGAAKGIVSARTQNNLLQGSLIGLSRVTPVAVFGLGVYGTAAIAAGLAVKSAIGSAADFEQQLNTFQAVTKSTAEQMRQVAEAARRLGADVSLPAISAGDAAVAMTELAKAGLSVNDTLAASKGVLQLASAANIDVGSAAQIAATQLNAFQLAGDQATRVAELLADASISAQGEITDFAAGFQQVSAVANQVGLSIEDTTALLTELGKAGLRGADGGTSLRTALLRLVPTTKEATEFQKALGISLDETKSIGDQIVPLIEQYRTALADLTPVQQQQALTQIFGQDAIRAASIIFSQQEGALRRLTTQFEEQNSIQDLTDAKAKGLKGAFANLQSQAETLGEKLGSFTTGPLTSLTTGLADTVKLTGDVVAAFADFSSAVDNIDIPGTDEKVGSFFGDVFKDALFLGPEAAKVGIDQIKKARATVREEIARQDRLDRLARGQGAFGITPIGARGVDEDQQAAARSGFVAPLTAAAKKRRAAIEALNKAAAEEAKLGIEIPRALQQSLIDAQLKESLRAELNADNAIVAFFTKLLAGLKEGTVKFLAVSAQLLDAQRARNAVSEQINLNAQQAAEKRKQDAEDAIRIAKEDAAAQEQLRLTIVNIQTQRFDNLIASAALTKSIADDRKAFQGKRTLLEVQRRNAQTIAKDADSTKQEVSDARLKVAQLDGQINDLTAKINGLGKKAVGGFSLAELFNEAVNQFNTFGSNIAGRNGILSPQDARADLGRTILQGRDAALAVQGRQLTTQEKMLAVLASIDQKVGSRTSNGSPPVDGKGKTGNLLDVYGVQIAAAYGYGN